MWTMKCRSTAISISPNGINYSWLPFCRLARRTRIEMSTHDGILPDPLKSSYIISCFPEFTLGIARQNLSVPLKELLKIDILSTLGSCVKLCFRRVLSHLTCSSSAVVRMHITYCLSHDQHTFVDGLPSVLLLFHCYIMLPILVWIILNRITLLNLCLSCSACNRYV
jgi:hypothetical protein